MEYAVIHYGEIGLKGQNRSYFERRLVENIKLALKGQKYDKIERLFGRIAIKLNKSSDKEKIKSALKQVPGITYFSFALHSKTDLASMKKALLKVAKGTKKTNTFRITARKATRLVKLGSMEVNEKLGALIVEKFGSKVKLKEPELNFIIEITQDGAFTYKEKIKGLGGLPVGMTGRVVSLISGGIDSPVAAFKMFKRGCTVVFVHFHNHTASRNIVKDKVLKLVKVLSKYQLSTKLYLVPFEELQKELITKIPSKYRMIVYRRFMFRIAEKVLRKEGAKAFVTGDSLAQVASQTLENLRVIYSATDVPILAPLIGSDKQEIIDLSQKIGTYETSILPYSDCCSFLVAEHPETKARLLEIESLEKAFDIEKLVKQALDKTRIERI